VDVRKEQRRQQRKTIYVEINKKKKKQDGHQARLKTFLKKRKALSKDAFSSRVM
jgi:hypothetical protein